MKPMLVNIDGKMAINPIISLTDGGTVICSRCGMDEAMLEDPEHGALCPVCVLAVPEVM